MGSLRNPVGPLPSSIYWRRRAALLSLLVVVGLVLVWLVVFGSGNDKHHDSGGSDGKGPAPSITPGPSSSGPAISQHPGGRDESSDGGSSGGGGDSGGGDSAGGTDGGATDGGATGGAGEGGAQTGGGSVGHEVPAGSSLPTCTSGAVKLTLHTHANTYDPGEKPRLELAAKNTSGTDCKLDLGAKNAVLTITQADGDKQLWASDDCPSGSGSLFLRVPAGTSITHTVTWDRKPSAPHCATPPANSAAPGTYLAEAKAPGFAKTQTSFVLDKD
ncbi:hypothetical protein [Streptomyces odontomachi]|uniref:hypothetical protein n=1 Tax=Streptomyces odontomachi TaxID=2944940 RepID=UPI0021095532|nr:hypothetical protein [Streptomyces sp. ODS25]